MQEQPDKPFDSPRDGGIGVLLVISAILWPWMVRYVALNPFDSEGWRSGLLFGTVPTIAFTLVLTALLLRTRHWRAALWWVLLLPLTAIPGAIFGRSFEHLDLGFALNLAAAGAFGAAVALAVYGIVARGPHPSPGALIPVRRVIDLVCLFTVVVALSSYYVFGTLELEHRSYMRSRVSELILAASSAKTGLSEGMQTYGTWSADWMNAITITPRGLVAGASIGAEGRITVYGTAPTSFATITLTPSVTTDNKLVWSCTGTPAKYMPASCR